MGSLCRCWAAASLYRAASRSSGTPPPYPSATLAVCHATQTTVSASASGRGGSAVRSAEPGQCLRPFWSPRVSTAEVRDSIQDRLGTDWVARTVATGRVRPCWDRRSLQRQVRAVPLHLPTLVKDPCSTLSPQMNRFLISENHYVYSFSF
uniref:Uncharacterized protein n=1 Tax=Colobus angolensis palliatus TaxID=336983 RepID=A0A2K5IGA4_COLAP